MKMFLKLFRNLLILELSLFAPGMWLIFSHLQDRLDVQVETAEPLSLTVNGQTEGCPVGKNAGAVQFFFADQIDPQNLKLKFVGGQSKFNVKSATWTENLLVRYDLAVQADSDMSYAIRGKSFSGFELPPIPGATILFWAFQICLLILAAIGLLVQCKDTSRQMWVRSVVLGGVFALFFVVILPLQTIFGNRFDFPFAVSDIAQQLALWFVVYFVIVSLLLRISAKAFGRWPFILLLAILTYEYLETGILSAGNPSLNGSIVHYLMRAPAIKDALWMLGVFAIFLIFAKWIGRYIAPITLVLLVMMLASLADVGSANKEEIRSAAKQDDSPWQVHDADVADSIQYSPTRNVIFLVLDSMQSDASYDVITHDEELRKDFDGFCAYNNNIGAQSYTILAMPSIFTGRYSPDPKPGQEFVASHFAFMRECWASDSFWTNYLNQKYALYIMPSIYGDYNYSNRCKATGHKSENKLRTTNSVFTDRCTSMHMSLYDCLRFRIVPFILKCRSLRVSLLGVSGSLGLEDERIIYSMIASHALSKDPAPALILVATNGTHDPIHYDENGNRIYQLDNDYDAVRGQAHFVLKCVAGLMRDLKRKGVYDKSMIVIVGDHGSHTGIASKWPHLKDVSGTALPMLWIKNFNSKNDLCETRVPTSHIKLSELMKKVADRNLTSEEIDAILKTEVRHFRKGNDMVDHYEDFNFDANGRRIEK